MSCKEWKETTLGEVVDKVIDYRGKTPKKLDGDWSAWGYRALSAKNIKTGKIVQQETIRCVNEELYKKWMKDEVAKNDILITSEAPFGEVYFWNTDEKIVLSQRLFALRSSKNVYAKFLYYYMTTYAYQQELRNRATGTTVIGLRQPELLKTTIKYPSIPEQKAIADTLSCLDDKIELNNRINKTLEEMAQAIFKSWFVDFEPFQEGEFVDSELGMIPKGWRVVEISEISKDIVCGKTPPTKDIDNYGNDIPFITIPDMHGNVYVTKTERKLSKKGILTQKNKTVPANSICVSCIATAGLVSLASEDSQTNQQINTIICCDEICPYFVFLTLNTLSNYIRILGSSGSTTCNLNKMQFSKIKIILPTNAVLNNFHMLITPEFSEIKEIQYQNQNLSEIRDTLLPKLMSGEIDVSQISI